jgi:uncharacterized protein YacL
MNISLSFIRALFLMMSILFLTTYTTTFSPGGLTFANLTIGIVGGTLFGMIFIALEMLFKNMNLRSFNICILGLFCGYLMGEAIMLIFRTILDLSTLPVTTETITLVRMAVFLFSAYFGVVITLRASEELHISIPFITFNSTATQKKKDIVLDASTLLDTRIIDLATSGLLDGILIMPRFVLKELNHTNESSDEAAKAKARRCLEVIRKLENIPALEMRYDETDFPELKDSLSKITRLARMLDASIMTADLNRVQQSACDGIRVINIHTLSNALKPITQNGEFLNIKIQRYGKEPRQGVGYLDDGTMVVVNGGVEYIGETIKAQVLSVKHTSSGRMIFCNTTDEHMLHEQEITQSVTDMENSHKNYFAL